MTNTKAIRDFVVANFLFGDAAGLEDDASFLDTGIVDSTGILELIMFLESTYAIKIASEEMLPDNLDSINKVAAFLNRRVGQPAPNPAAGGANEKSPSAL